MLRNKLNKKFEKNLWEQINSEPIFTDRKIDENMFYIWI